MATLHTDAGSADRGFQKLMSRINCRTKLIRKRQTHTGLDVLADERNKGNNS